MNPMFFRRLAAVLSILFLITTSADAAYVHPVWGPSRAGTPVSVPATPYSQLYWQRIEQNAQESQQKQRVCKRVLNRYGSDISVLERMNARIRERFGFVCSPDDASAGRSRDQGSAPTDPAELRIARDAFNPVNDFVPRGASRVPVLRLVFSASCMQDVTIDDILFRDTGAGLPSDITHVWMSVDGVRVSRARALNRDKSVQLRFRRPYTIPACKSRAIDVYAAVSPVALASGRHTFSLDAPEDVFADAPVTGEFPMSGERMSISGSTGGRIQLTYLPIEAGPRIEGTGHEVLGRFRVDIDSTEDQTIHAMTLRQGGTIFDGDILGIYVRSTHGHARFSEIAERMMGDQAYVRFDPPFPMEKGETMELDIVGNLASGTGRTLRMEFEEPVDLYAVGSLFGYGRNGQLYGSNVTLNGTAQTLKIKARLEQ